MWRKWLNLWIEADYYFSSGLYERKWRTSLFAPDSTWSVEEQLRRCCITNGDWVKFSQSILHHVKSLFDSISEYLSVNKIFLSIFF